MKMSFRLKVIACFLAIIVFSMVTLTFLSSVMLKPVFISNSKNTMIEYAEKINSCLTQSAVNIDELLEDINLSFGITTHILDENCEIIYSYSKIKKGETRRRYEDYIKMYEERKSDSNYIFSKIFDADKNEKKIVFISGTPDGSYILMRKAVKGVEQDISIVSIFILLAGITIAIIGTVAWSIFTKSFTDKMKKMSRITREMSKLNFEEKINYKSKDEIGVLAESIDTLSDELKSSIEELQNDVERRKRLVRDISHELKTPITTVKGYLESIQLLTKDDPKLQRYCSIANDECDEINALVEEMLEMSRMESDAYSCDMEKVQISQIMNAVRSKIEAEYPDRKIEIAMEECLVTCNSVLLTRAIMNFVKNAVKHGDKDGEIEVTGVLQDEKYIFRVTSCGAPIPYEERELIWDLFYKNDKARRRDSSHGIGLAMVRKIALLHGGDVGVISMNNKNTFYFYILSDS